MRKTSFFCLLILAVALTLFAFNFAPTGAVKGRVLPTDGVLQVSVAKGKDTVVANLVNGQFKIGLLKRGVYSLVVKSKLPLKDTVVQNVAVIDSATTDVGDVKLSIAN